MKKMCLFLLWFLRREACTALLRRLVVRFLMRCVWFCQDPDGKPALTHRWGWCQGVMHLTEVLQGAHSSSPEVLWSGVSEYWKIGSKKYLNIFEKCNMLKRMFEYSMIFILDIRIFEYLCIEVLPVKIWHLTHDTGNLTCVTQECEHCLKISGP